MKRPEFARFACIFAFLACGIAASGQSEQCGSDGCLYYDTTVTLTAYSVHLHTYAEVDYDTAYYYDLSSTQYFYQDYTAIVYQTTTSTGDYTFDYYYTPTGGHWYQGGAVHSLTPYYLEYVYSDITYEYEWDYFDPFSYYLLDNPSPPPSDPVYIIEPEVQAYISQGQIVLAESWDNGDGTDVPVLTNISVSGSQARGGSGSISLYGNYLTTKNAGVGSANIPGITITGYTYDTSTYPWTISFNYLIPATASTGNHSVTESTVWGTSNALTFTVYDPTPAITSVSPDPWDFGATTTFTVNGTGFGSNPSISVSGAGVASSSITSGNDTQITGSLNWGSNPVSGNATITVTSNGYGGHSFMAAPQGGTTPTTSRQQGLITIKREEIGSAMINTSNKYSEDTTVRVTAVRSDTGATVATFTGTVNISEDGTAIYSQNGGSLPASVYISSGGTVTFTASSLAGPKVTGGAPDPAKIKSTNRALYAGAELAIFQWVDLGQTIYFPRATGSWASWAKARLRDIVNNASGDVQTVFNSISSFAMSDIGASSLGVTIPSHGGQGAVTINPYHQNAMRMDTSILAVGCGTVTQAFSNTALHEGRHSYQGFIASVANDADQDYLVNNVPIAPTNIVTDTTAYRWVCNTDLFSLESRRYKGDASFDYLDSPDHVRYALEQDAATFAGSH